MNTPDQIVDFNKIGVGPSNEFLLCPVNGGVMTPAYNDCGAVDMVIMTSKPVCGDVDCSGGIDIADLVYLVDYMFTGGLPLCDPDGNGSSDCLK